MLPKEIAALLQPGEDLLWSGRPRIYVFILRGMVAASLGTVWSILGAYWYEGAMMAPWEGYWKLVPNLSLPFIALGWSFFFYPIHLGKRARRTWYLVTTKRVMIVRWHAKKPVELRVFTRKEMGPPLVVKRFDKLYEVVLTRSAQERPFLVPRLEAGFFGIPDGEAAAAAVRKAMAV